LHGWSKTKGQTQLYEQVRVQTLWAEKKAVHYFEVSVEGVNDGDPKREDIEDVDEAWWDDVERRFRQGEKPAEVVQEPTHVSEMTPWLRTTGYQAHLSGMSTIEIEASCKPPDEDEPELELLCGAAERVVRSAMDIIRGEVEGVRLNRLNARHLNTIRVSEINSDPIKPLQNKRSEDRYVGTWGKLICYFSRVARQSCLVNEAFTMTGQQQEAFSLAWHLAERQLGYDVPELRREPVEGELEEAVLALSMSFITHKLGDSKGTDSALVSFAAVMAWDGARGTWHEVRDHTSVLSQLVYCCQAVVLAHCVRAPDSGVDLTGRIVEMRDLWLRNDTPGPVTELNGNRLLGMGMARKEVGLPQLRWSDDGQVVAFQDVQIHMDEIGELMGWAARKARATFEDDLCFGMGAPRLDLGRLLDDWGSSKPGHCFMDDPRNADQLDAYRGWVLKGLREKPELATLIMKKTASGWKPTSAAVRAYLASANRFLEYLMTLMHLTSGQPGRGPELLGLRWCNVQADKRNLFLHDGRVLFVLTYHKSLNITNGSRYPVRFATAEAGQLLVQYLVLIRGFVSWLIREEGLEDGGKAYLWCTEQVWDAGRVTDVLATHSREAIGTRLTVRAWRQIAVGIAIKKLARYGVVAENDEAADGWAGPDEDGEAGLEGSMPEALHWQASHAPRTGNMVYGGTVDFKAGLTDAGLHEFRKASELWQGLWRETAQAQVRKRAGDSLEGLPKRLAAGKARRPRCVWTAEEAQRTLKRMYGPEASYRGGQEELVKALINNREEVVAVLATGEGKSLAYQLTARLPGAGTTVLVTPLVALKMDTIRRCERVGIRCCVWKGDNPPTTGTPLVVVSLEQAVSRTFGTYLNGLSMVGGLARVVLDECHLVCTADHYRQVMREAKKLRAFQCQFVMLTATLPPRMQGELEKALLLKRPTYVRCDTARRDLRYEVKRCPEVDWEGEIYDAGAIMTRGDRGIVFARTKVMADKLGELLGCGVYHSSAGTRETREKVLSLWLAGGSGDWLVATSALAGLDHPSIRAVVHVGEPPGAIDFAQDTGRMGRDGKGGKSTVLLSRSWKSGVEQEGGEMMKADRKVMQDYLEEPWCRVAVLSGYLDGQARGCDKDRVACDRCQSRAGDSTMGTPHESLQELDVPDMTAPSATPYESLQELDVPDMTAPSATPYESLQELDVPDMTAPSATPYMRVGRQELATPPDTTPHPTRPMYGGERRELDTPAMTPSRLVTSAISRETHDTTVIETIPDPHSSTASKYHSDKDDSTGSHETEDRRGTLQRHEMEEGKSKARYVQWLDGHRGSCMLCLVSGLASDGHGLDACTSAARSRFLSAKVIAIREGKGRGGWLAKYCACFTCGNTQGVCREHGRKGCRYGDTAMPLTWCVRERASLMKGIEDVLGDDGRLASGNEGEWMRWLGTRNRIWGEACTKMAIVAAAVSRVI